MRKSGFTLLELSIVLVIIGLIVGGVLVGRDLIKSAQIRATVAQVEQFKTANNTFRTKYNALPGDMLPAQAGSFGMFQLAGGASLGDGDGYIEGFYCNGEALAYWRHLSEASLVAGNFGQTGNAIITPADGRPTGSILNNIELSAPRSKISQNGFFSTSSASWVNTPGGTFSYYILIAYSMYSNAGCTGYTPPMTPIEMYNIDVKLDDGIPWVGTVRGGDNWSGTQIPGTCSFGGADMYSSLARYSISAATGTTPTCNGYFLF